jgi:dTDP-glucose pyrophosphorylase
MTIRKAVVLAAGRGKRMGELTDDLPKPMLPVNGKPMLQHVLEALAAAGVEQAALVVGYRREVILDHFAGYGLPLTFLTQEVPNGTGTATLLAREFAGADPFLLTFGDILCSPAEYTGLGNQLREDTDAVAGVKWVDDPWRGAAVYVDEDCTVTRILEKPAPGTSTTNWNSAGLYAFRQSVFPELERLPLSPRGEYELTTAVETLVSSGRRVRIHAIQHEWRDVGTPEDLNAVRQQPPPQS